MPLDLVRRRPRRARQSRSARGPARSRGPATTTYRAAGEDVAQDEQDKATLIACPTLALWGEEFESGGKMWDFCEIWAEMAERVEFVSIPECGYHPREEKPEAVDRELLRFLGS